MKFIVSRYRRLRKSVYKVKGEYWEEKLENAQGSKSHCKSMGFLKNLQK